MYLDYHVRYNAGGPPLHGKFFIRGRYHRWNLKMINSLRVFPEILASVRDILWNGAWVYDWSELFKNSFFPLEIEPDLSSLPAERNISLRWKCYYFMAKRTWSLCEVCWLIKLIVMHPSFMLMRSSLLFQLLEILRTYIVKLISTHFSASRLDRKGL